MRMCITYVGQMDHFSQVKLRFKILSNIAVTKILGIVLLESINLLMLKLIVQASLLMLCR